ncbi:MAG: LacI family DNA-binding transcriptional regulator [Phycisphaeraceae bacterium]|nr:LacI family DNA-binding transcriptional regulator [Phycisphaeraceae bacterium]
MAVTMNQIAKRLGLSQATVSRALTNKWQGLISAETHDRVIAVAEELGYRPNRFARALVTGRTGVVALWIRNPEAPFYSSVLHGVMGHARRAGYQLFLTGHHQDRGGEPEPGFQGTWPVDGVLAVDCPRRVRAYMASVSSAEARVDTAVLPPIIGMSSDYAEDLDYVAFDVESGVLEAVRHLVSIGCRRIAHLTGWCTIDRVRRGRAAAYQRVLRESGLPSRFLSAPNETRAAAREVVREDIERHGSFDGLFCLNDDMAIGACCGIRDAGLRVGEDVAVVGCDGIVDGEFLATSLSTIVQPVEQMCDLAWEALSRRMAEPTSPVRQVVLHPWLKVRESTLRFASTAGALALEAN